MRVALQGEAVLCAFPVGAEADLNPVPAVLGAVAVRFAQVGAAVTGGIDPKGRAVAEPTPVAQADILVAIAASDAGQDAQRVLGAAAGDVDHPVHGIGAPQRAAGSTDHLDAVDVVQQHMVLVPVDAGIERGVDAAPVDQHQQLGGRLEPTGPSGGDGIVERVDALDLKVRRQAQGLGQAHHPGAAQVLSGDHKHRGGGLAQRLGPLGNRGDLDLGEFFDGEAAEIVHAG